MVAYAGQQQQQYSEYYRQQVISNAENAGWNGFAEPLRGELVHHSKINIPLIPTGEVASLDMQYLLEVLFETSGQSLTLQLRDPRFGRLLKLNVQVADDGIQLTAAVNHRRMNHVDNDEGHSHYQDGYHYWDME
jgi:hypothetical protein